jgi:hypothetical protein
VPPPLSIFLKASDGGVLIPRTLFRAVLAGGGRFAFTSGGDGTRNGEDIIRLVRISQAISPRSWNAHYRDIGGLERSTAEVDSFPCHMSSFCSCSHTFSALYLPVFGYSRKINLIVYSCPNQSQRGIYLVAHSMSVLLCRIV